MSKIICFIIVTLIIITIAQNKLVIGLTENCLNIDCLTSLTQSDCENGVLIEKHFLGCCPGCDTSGVKCGKTCDISNPSCAAGLQCDEKQKECVRNKDSCHHLAHIDIDTWKPECYPSGKYKEKQCRGDKVSGRCFCFSETGQKIFGWDWRYNEQEMTCSCSRHRSTLEAKGRISTLHCQQNGNYEELQCDAGVCFCVDTKNGQLQAGTKILPDTLWTKLPCYNETLYGDTYLRQCESMAVVQKKINKLFELHGTKDAAIEMTNCNYDGSYGLHTLQEKEVKCIWRDGKIIDPYSESIPKISLVDCACAIDQKIYEEHNMPFKLTCSSNGNYQEVQLQNEKYFCVDALGYAVSDFESTELTKDFCDTRRYDRIKTNC